MGDLTVFEQIFLEHLNYGVENAVTSKLLAHKFKIDRRRVTKTVSDMCRKGVPIVAAMKRINKLKALTSDDYKKVELTRKGVFNNDQ